VSDEQPWHSLRPSLEACDLRFGAPTLSLGTFFAPGANSHKSKVVSLPLMQ
jgi:hypothetical protein